MILAVWFFFLPLSFFLSQHVGAAASSPLSFTFDFSNPSSYNAEDLFFEGDALPISDYIDLTCEPTEKNCIGRMTYKHPVLLYDNNTGELASFATSFTFSIQTGPTSTSKGDGMAFFLSGYPSRLPRGSNHDMLGLTRKSTIPTGGERFLDVEFDTFSNTWDPKGASDHMGIDLSNMTSIVAKRLPSDSLNGTMTATITFDNTTRTLVATLHFDDNDSSPDAQVKTKLPDDLELFLPTEVAVGFSASTGANEELHQIYSWSFNSTMAATETPPGDTNVHPEQGQVLDTKAHGHGRALIIGGAVILVLALMLAIWSILSWYRWKRTCDFFGKGSRLWRFEYRDLCIATNKFCDTKKIGEGGYGVVYGGSLMNEQVAVKRILKDSSGEFKDFLAELGAIGRTAHGNVVRLEGSKAALHCLRTSAKWKPPPTPARKTRSSTIMGKEVQNSQGLMVRCSLPPPPMHPLHPPQRHQAKQHTPRQRIQRQARGLWAIEGRPAQRRNVTADKQRAVGTMLYMDPLRMKDGHVNFGRSSDVYSFGIVLLEIAHGECNPDRVRRLHHADRPAGRFVEEVADRRLGGQFDREEMEQVIVLGLRCCDLDEKQRPSLNSVTSFLENDAELCSPVRHSHPP